MRKGSHRRSGKNVAPRPSVRSRRVVAGVCALVAVFLIAWLFFSRHAPDVNESAPAHSQAVARELSDSEHLAAAADDLGRGESAKAEIHLRAVLGRDPQRLDACNQLAYLLGVEGRSFEATPFLLEPVRQGRFTLHHLVLLGALEPVVNDVPLINRCDRAGGQNLLPLVGKARTAIKENRYEDALASLRKAKSACPDSVEAHVQLGLLQLNLPSADWSAWERDCPANAAAHPGIWTVRGLRLRAAGQDREAVRCFLEAARRDANQRIAHFELGQLLAAIGERETAERFATRAESLRQLGYLVDDIYKSPQDSILLRKAARLTESLDRILEAAAWLQLALSVEPTDQESRQHLNRLQAHIDETTPHTLFSGYLVSDDLLASYPLPQFAESQVVDAASGSGPRSQVRFTEVAKAAGIDFIYQVGSDPTSGQPRMLDTTGGGVAVIDYDADGWPDLYFTQASAENSTSDAHPLKDRLFRNLGNGRFADVTEAAGLGDELYSQGVAVGDFDNDGFPDLYVANFGVNRLYHNNGDGTFRDITEQLPSAEPFWTTSCLIADLNGDSLPDLYDVNYLLSNDAVRAVCRKGEELQWCSPNAFHAEQDRLLLNQGDGTFRDVTEQAGILHPDGKGLGIVAADFAESGQLSLFVANDATPNFLFVNQNKRGEPPVYEQRALLSGVAVSDEGLPQACMGVAIADANGDQRLDMFVTNFYDESNAFYVGQPGELFADQSRTSGLRGPSLKMLGFGTQFIDAELDSHPDLVVTNGHVLDLSHRNVPYQMPPQYFANLGEGRFAEVNGAKIGDYFKRKYLGRGLARLDWNRDGKEDFVVSHMREPAALLVNETPQVGNFLALQLRGVISDRDAIGTSVRVKIGQRVLYQQLTAGDGFQASNERQLIFGLGATPRFDLTLRWPSGHEQHFTDVPANQHLLLIEGRDEAFSLR